MGFTPLEGLLMGTRSGDLDPSVLEFLSHKEGMSLSELDTLLNKQSGLLGISGLTGDMRDLLAEEAENGDRRARLAVDIFCRRVRKYIGAYMAADDGTDAILFTGGIGENSAPVRRRILEGLDKLGIRFHYNRNEAVAPGSEGRITSDGSPIEAWVIPTNEELLIARDTVRVVTDAPRRW
jgi:acetate kinase